MCVFPILTAHIIFISLFFIYIVIFASATLLIYHIIEYSLRYIDSIFLE